MGRIRRTIVAVAGVALLGTGLVAAPAGAGGGDEPLEATEIGVTADAIRIAVIADVDNPVRPGLFRGSRDGVLAAAEFINDNGGLAGRQVEVDFIDSRLSGDEARSALIQACEEDFAIVGTTALFMNNIDPAVSCPDLAGTVTGLPDVPVLQTEFAHQCSPISYPIIVVGLDCTTLDDPEQTFRTGQGHVKYHLGTQEEDLHGVWTIASDLPATIRAATPPVRGAQKAGIGRDDEIQISGLATQTEYTPVVQSIKQNNSTYVANYLDYRGMVLLRKEAAIQGVDSVVVWDCTLACYDQRFIEEGGEDVEGTYVTVTFVPFEEAKQNASIRNYLEYVGEDNADAFGAQAWAAGLFFRDVVNAIVAADGENGLTRAAFLEQAADIHDFTAEVDGEGMLAPTDVGGRKVKGCGAVLQVRDGEFVRRSPKKKGTLNCGDVVKVTIDLA
ncbi:MAG: ABC transporter substrate-binding protein [Actinobacteria bacterium]|nr:ABC transporter substrate-binding protein [Actinomycetota bacterium]